MTPAAIGLRIYAAALTFDPATLDIGTVMRAALAIDVH
jgi:hypothetical protein